MESSHFRIHSCYGTCSLEWVNYTDPLDNNVKGLQAATATMDWMRFAG